MPDGALFRPLNAAGCGPLLYLLGSQYVNAGVKRRAIVDTTAFADYTRALPHAFGALASAGYLRKGLAAMLAAACR